MASTDALPLPRKNVAFRLYFTARTSAGVLVTAFTSPDSEVSKDGGAYADCTNEATYVGHGQGYIDLTATEMNADNVAFYFSCTEGEIESPVVIYPAEDGDISFSQLRTTIATLASQTSFTLTDGPPDDDALSDMALLIRDASTAGQFTVGVVTDYTGSTKTVTFGAGAKFGTRFTVAVGDSVTMLGLCPLVPTVAARSLDVTSGGGAGIDWSNVENSGTSVGLSATTISTSQTINTCSQVTTVNGLASNSITAASIATDAGTEIAAAVRTNLTTELGYLTGDSYARLGAPAGASVSADVAAVKVDTAAVLADTGTDGVILADSEDVYPADIQFTRDDDNDKDEYTVLWFRNGTPVTSGITVPLIQVVKRADGTDLIASTAMTQIGSTGAYKYDESTAASRIDDGEAVVVICTATINGSARSWRKTVTRDDTN